MAASATQNPSSAASKSSKKKKSKGELPSSSAVTSAPAVEIASTEAPESSNGDGSYESPYIKELYKSIRNVNKKIANASKVDNILAENPKLSLDELVASRKINTDQKAQILKKPSLQASLTQLEEQIAQYKKFDQEYKARSQKEKDEFEKTFTEKAEVDLSEAIASTKAEAASQIAKEQHDNMLVLSQFLSLAAIRRIDSDPSLDENKALEGVLLQVYRGNETAVASMVKLINGSDDPVYSTDGEALSTTYATVKALAVSHASAGAADEEEQSVSAQESESTSHPVETDPTTANAGMTELDDPTVADMINGQNLKADSDEAAPIVPENAGIDEGAANNAAGTQWDADNDLSKSQEWVEVPRDVGETDTGLTATPAVTANKQSWADEQADASASVNPNDGFHEVQRNRGGRDRGGRGGRGGDSGYRGRGGYRGNDGGYRGRGRGGPRGGAPREGGAPRQRRTEES